jgi:hypothetical protein
VTGQTDNTGTARGGKTMHTATTARTSDRLEAMTGRQQEAADLEGRAADGWAVTDRQLGASVSVAAIRSSGYVPGPHCDETDPAEWAGEPVDPLDN